MSIFPGRKNSVNPSPCEICRVRSTCVGCVFVIQGLHGRFPPVARHSDYSVPWTDSSSVGPEKAKVNTFVSRFRSTSWSDEEVPYTMSTNGNRNGIRLCRRTISFYSRPKTDRNNRQKCSSKCLQITLFYALSASPRQLFTRARPFSNTLRKTFSALTNSYLLTPVPHDQLSSSYLTISNVNGKLVHPGRKYDQLGIPG